MASDPDAATQWVSALPDADQRAAAHTSLARQWAQTDSYEASEWIGTLPAGKDRDAAAAALVQSIAKAEPDSAWAWALSIQDESQRSDAAAMALMHWQARDPESARVMLDQANLPPAEKSALRKGFQNHQPASGATPRTR